MNSGSAARLAAGLSGCLFLASCAAQRFHIPSPVPPPLHEHVVDAPSTQAWDASLHALGRLGLAPAETNPGRARLVSEFRAVDGNSEHHRTTGIARFAVERDIYSAGRWRLLVTLTAAAANQTEVHVDSEVQAWVERRGDVQYGEKGTPTTATSETLTADWHALTSNGVLEDEFLAALVAELSGTGAWQR